ncbi:MAG: adenylate cyclase [Gammaproteobacteria bacterium]|nr:adenylate cyclase [Gammaproteobacteria bacterium]
MAFTAEEITHLRLKGLNGASIPVGWSADCFEQALVPPRTAYATVLVADMRGYTGLAEQLAPALVLPLLLEFFALLTRVTVAYGGQVFHMAGDGMMAGFGVDEPNRDGARQAFGAGYAMLHRFAVIASRWRTELSIATGIGVGLNLGEVALACLGPPGQRAPMLVGDTTNVASLLCGHARAGEVLLSGSVAAALIADGGLRPGSIGPVSKLKLPRSLLRGRRGRLDFWCVPDI